jgi:hypothetical protein
MFLIKREAFFFKVKDKNFNFLTMLLTNHLAE